MILLLSSADELGTGSRGIGNTVVAEFFFFSIFGAVTLSVEKSRRSPRASARVSA